MTETKESIVIRQTRYGDVKLLKSLDGTAWVAPGGKLLYTREDAEEVANKIAALNWRASLHVNEQWDVY